MSWKGEFTEEMRTLYHEYDKKFGVGAPDDYIDYQDAIEDLPYDEWKFYIKDAINLNLEIEDYFDKYEGTRFKKEE